MIEVKNLTKKYGDHVAIHDLSFTVEKGRVYGFLGPNGAGKSTTMNIITGYLAPTEGTVLIDGKDIMREPEEAKKKIGYLPELPPLYNDMTVGEYLMFVAELKKVPKQERKNSVRLVMEETEVTDMEHRLIKNLSKGYKQRVGMAEAMIGNPDVLILDEPTVGLDPKQIIEIRDLIKKLGESHTIILSSHILSEVSAVCDHILIISKGKLVASDSPENLKKRLGGSMRLDIVVATAADEAITLLKSIDGVDTAEITGADEKGYSKILVTGSTDTDIREQVSILLAENRIPVMEMTKIEKSLEDIFLELTGNDESKKEDVKETTSKEDKDTAENTETENGEAVSANEPGEITDNDGTGETDNAEVPADACDREEE